MNKDTAVYLPMRTLNGLVQPPEVRLDQQTFMNYAWTLRAIRMNSALWNASDLFIPAEKVRWHTKDGVTAGFVNQMASVTVTFDELPPLPDGVTVPNITVNLEENEPSKTQLLGPSEA